MTLFDFIYGIGSGVAFIMALVGLTAENNKMPETDRCYAGVIVYSLFCASLSWSVPIWWIGFEFYKKLIKQDKLKKEIKQLKEQLESDFQKADAREYELATKFNNTYSENQQLKDLLKECKEFFEEENPKDFTVMSERMDELLINIDNAIGEKK